MKISLFLLLATLFVHPVVSQTITKTKFDSYSTVRVFVQAAADLHVLQKHGIDIEHYRGQVGEYIEIVISQVELEALQLCNLPYAVTIGDMDSFHANRQASTEEELRVSKSILNANGIQGFGYGSMGGFYTYQEVVRQLDSMRLQFPSLITVKDSIGVTAEGRTIWAVEISDNPGLVEPGESVVYFDALHHAREPQGMAALMYYMYWLLDNYGTNPEATYLVNNRRTCFVPVANPDGYVRNQTTNPNGGGGWRKNRRDNGDGSFGVDLNRNYGYKWGYDNSGSSPTPSSDTYRGPSPFSEPESRAVRDYATMKQPSTAFSVHSVAGRYLNPYGYADSVVAYEYYAEFASDFSAQNNYLYGTVAQMLDYTSNGTTRDYLHHDVNCLTWTPEVGGSGFWPAQAEIIPVAQENLYGFKYLTWVSGAFADYQSVKFINNQYTLPGDTLRMAVVIRNKGLTLAAQSVNISLQSLSANATPIATATAYSSIPSRQSVSNDATPFIFRITSAAQLMDEMKFVSVITQEGIETSRDTFSIVVGYPRVLFADDAEGGIGNWTRSGNQIPWDTTFVMAYSGSSSFADTRYGNVGNSTNNALATTNAIDLVNVLNPRLEYFARWANQGNSDYVRIQLSTNNGTSWTNLTGRNSVLISGQPSYTANKGFWAWESIPLASVIGQQVRLRFNLITNSSLRGDGFYFDDFRVVDYRDSVMTGVRADRSVPFLFSLDQNYPNPFNPTTTIAFSVPSKSENIARGRERKGSHTTLRVYDLLGREVAALVNEVKQPGSYEVMWDASGMASGVYLYRLQSGQGVHTRKLILLR